MAIARLINIALALGACIALYLLYDEMRSPARETLLWEARRTWSWVFRFIALGVVFIVFLSIREWINGKIRALAGTKG